PVGTVHVVLGGEEPGLTSWSLTGIDLSGRDEADVDGVRTRALADDDPALDRIRPVIHPNGVTQFDHLVLMTPNLDRTIDALAAIGLELRRTRDAGSADHPLRQAFFRVGEVILEVVGPPEADGNGPASWFGLAFTANDLDELAAHLGPGVGRIKDAVQPGHRITTLRHRDVGFSLPTAFMDERSGRETARG
ncbi:MAG TPA: VOC family protein, partial [Acidimicrobiales bacterium]